MFFKKKKPFTRFVNLLPGVEAAYPVLKAHEYSPDWLRKAAVDYRERAEQAGISNIVGGANRCPGLLNYFKQGFIITAPMDFTITTYENSQKGFNWQTPGPAGFENKPYIGQHPPDQLAKFMPMREDTLPTLVKVCTFWKMNSSPDIVFLQLPIAYPDHNNFTAVHGFIDCEYYAEVNVQLFWHKLNQITLIEAGTPLCQLIPIPRALAVDFIVEQATEQDRYISRAWDYLVTNKYKKNMKEFYASAKRLLGKQ
jgi:hypothetical protein